MCVYLCFFKSLAYRGFKKMFGRGNPLNSFVTKMNTLEQQTGGRVIARFPADLGEGWFDKKGVKHPVPVPPANLQHLNLLWEVQLNSSRLFDTSHRGASERGFGKDWDTRILGVRTAVPSQYLERYGKQPTPDVPKLHVFMMVDMAVKVCDLSVSSGLNMFNNVLGRVCYSF